MAKNLIPVIADCLGVRIGEEFVVTEEYKKYRFKFDERKCLVRNISDEELGWVIAADKTLAGLIYGEQEVIKLPFKPKKGDEFWSYAGFNFEPVYGTWQGDYDDFVALKAGCVFRTRAEALEALPAKYKELTGREWKE